MELLRHIEQWLEKASANIKLVDQALSGMEGSYVELLTILALGLLAVVPVIVPQERRQFYRRLNQIFGILIFIFVVYTCLGVFGMIRNFFRGLGEIGRENIIALYFCSVPVTVMATSMLFGPTFCGWICPTGALQEFTGMLVGKWHVKRKMEGWKFSAGMLVFSVVIAGAFLAWISYLSLTRVFFVEDATIYWSEVLVILLFILTWKMHIWDGKLRRLRVVSFAIVVLGAIAGWRITSPVHFTFAKVYDPASVLSTIMVIFGALAIPNVWCRYLCPWREAIAWAGKHSARQLDTDGTKCVHCKKCDEVCSVDAVKEGKIDKRECHMCMKCADICPSKCIEVNDKWKAGD